MKIKRELSKYLISALVLGSSASGVMAGGFQLQEYNAAALGTAYAGGASLAEDVSYGYFNAASIAYTCSPQLVASAVGVLSDSKLNVFAATANLPTAANSGTGNTRIKGNAVIPGFAISTPINPNLFVSLNIASPYGLKTEYGYESPVRYLATRSELMTVDLAPSIAYRFNNVLTIGVGPNFVWGKAWYYSRINGLSANPVNDGYSNNKGDRWGYGWHVGLMYDFDDCNRIGISYRSKVNLTLKGDNYLRTSAGGNEIIAPITAKVTLPEVLRLGFTSVIDQNWTVVGDYEWVKWNRFQNLLITRNNANNTVTTTQTNTNFKNNWKVSLGGLYRLTDSPWLVRFGLAFDKTPVQDEFRTIRIPDSNRIWFAAGVKYDINCNMNVDLGAAYINFAKKNINEGGPIVDGTKLTNPRVEGKTNLNTFLLGVQFTWNFV